MAFDKRKIIEILNAISMKIKECAIEAEGLPKFWQLYLDANAEDTGLDIVDTCATSQCLSILLKSCCYLSTENKPNDLICDAVASVVGLRNNSGAWPSALTITEMADPACRREGDNAIGDNIFALQALIESGFLDDSFEYSEKLSEEFESLSKRLDFIEESIEWLLSNKAEDGVGWYYTNEKKKELKSVSLTTINVLYVLAEIYNEISKEKDNFAKIDEERINKFLSRIKNEIIKNYRGFFIQTKYNNAAVQQHVKEVSSDKESIIHTCKFVNFVLYCKRIKLLTSEDLSDFANFLNTEIKKEKFSIEQSEYMILFEPYCLHKTDHGISSRPIKIDHENYAEAIILNALINLKKENYDIDDELITKFSSQLLMLYKNKSFICRSKRDLDHHNPVYASCEAFFALDLLLNNFDILLSEEEKDEIELLISAIDSLSQKLEKDKVERVGKAVLVAKDEKYLKKLKKVRQAINKQNITEKSQEFSELKEEIKIKMGVE